MVAQVADFTYKLKKKSKNIYIERTEEKVDDLGIRLPHNDEWDDQQNGGQLESEPREYGSCQRVKDIEHD